MLLSGNTIVLITSTQASGETAGPEAMMMPMDFSAWHPSNIGKSDEWWKQPFRVRTFTLSPLVLIYFSFLVSSQPFASMFVVLEYFFSFCSIFFFSLDSLSTKGDCILPQQVRHFVLLLRLMLGCFSTCACTQTWLATGRAAIPSDLADLPKV